VLSAIAGFINSIALSPGKNLQDTLRLLDILYTHSQDRDVESAIVDGVSALSIDIWLEVRSEKREGRRRRGREEGGRGREEEGKREGRGRKGGKRKGREREEG
jgi:hypothetical protein